MISVTILISLAGCRLTNIDDVYSMADIEDEKKTTVVVDNKESKWHDDNKYYTIPEGVDIPPMVNMDDTVYVTNVCAADKMKGSAAQENMPKLNWNVWVATEDSYPVLGENISQPGSVWNGTVG